MTSWRQKGKSGRLRRPAWLGRQMSIVGGRVAAICLTMRLPVSAADVFRTRQAVLRRRDWDGASGATAPTSVAREPSLAAVAQARDRAPGPPLATRWERRGRRPLRVAAGPGPSGRQL